MKPLFQSVALSSEGRSVHHSEATRVYNPVLLNSVVNCDCPAGSIVDTDCSLYIGFMGSDNVKGYFEGYIDDVSNH